MNKSEYFNELKSLLYEIETEEYNNLDDKIYVLLRLDNFISKESDFTVINKEILVLLKQIRNMVCHEYVSKGDTPALREKAYTLIQKLVDLSEEEIIQTPIKIIPDKMDIDEFIPKHIPYIFKRNKNRATIILIGLKLGSIVDKLNNLKMKLRVQSMQDITNIGGLIVYLNETGLIQESTLFDYFINKE